MKTLFKIQTIVIISFIIISCSSKSNTVSVDTTYFPPSAIVKKTADSIEVLDLFSKIETELNKHSGGFYKVKKLEIYYLENDKYVILHDGKLKVGPELHCTVIIEFLKNGIIQRELYSMPYIEDGWIHTEIDKTKKNYIIDKGKWAEFNLNLGTGENIYWVMESISHTKKMYPEND